MPGMAMELMPRDAALADCGMAMAGFMMTELNHEYKTATRYKEISFA